MLVKAVDFRVQTETSAIQKAHTNQRTEHDFFLLSFHFRVSGQSQSDLSSCGASNVFFNVHSLSGLSMESNLCYSAFTVEPGYTYSPANKTERSQKYLLRKRTMRSFSIWERPREVLSQLLEVQLFFHLSWVTQENTESAVEYPPSTMSFQEGGKNSSF